MSDRLVLKNMVFYGYHGTFAAEQELGQKFEVDLEVYGDLPLSGDDPEFGFNALDAYTVIKDIVEEEEFQLPEVVAERIAEQILDMCDLEKVVVRVRKPFVPIGGPLDYLEVELTRYPK
ncbi:MAG: dihydroneopterin aldolase [Firmicutes bacterium]|mgnify:CR=1 FL=1|jgi:dihydroneopterin aldolase|nr:dihydroneopterin aldolase [Bacillota bacterium]NLO66294.1 dihydroneopterin aldolase [Bacillota bacterium]